MGPLLCIRDGACIPISYFSTLNQKINVFYEKSAYKLLIFY